MSVHQREEPTNTGKLYYRIPAVSLQSINQATEGAGPHLTMHGRVVPDPIEPPLSELSADGGQDHHGFHLICQIIFMSQACQGWKLMR